MTTTAKAATRLLVLGRADLLAGGPPLRDADPLALVTLPAQPTAGPANTVILRWAELEPMNVTVRTVDGRQAVHAHLPAGPLFDTFRPASTLRRLVDGIASPGMDPSPAPLLHATVVPASHGVDIHAYSPVEHSVEGMCLVRTTSQPLVVCDLDDLSWVDTALRQHADQASSLNSHQCAWRKAFPGQELEHKYTLLPDTPIWDLAVDTSHQIHHNALPGFVLKYHDQMQVWDYLNHLYDIHAPQAERGYVSFIPTAADDGWRMKRKWFTADTFARREQLTDIPAVTDLDAYVRDALHVKAKRMPTFRRIRYDVNIESLATGHYYGIFFDRCHLLQQSTVAMCQCEIEYCRTRTTRAPSETSVLEEIDIVADWTENLLVAHGIVSPRSHYSKLSFLRQAVEDHPDITITSI